MAGAGRLDIRLGLDAAEYTAGLDRAAQDAQKFERTLDSLRKSLKTQIETFGFSARQLTIYELAQRGATHEQLLSINALYKQKEALEAAAKAASNTAGIDAQIRSLQEYILVQGKSAREAKLFALAQDGATESQLRAADAALRAVEAQATRQGQAVLAQRALQEAEANAAAIDKQVQSLQNQSAVLGETERQVKLYELTLAGATKEQLSSADAALRQKEAFLQAGKAVDSANAAAAKQKAASDEINKEIKALQDKVAVLGKSKEATKLYELTQKGATQEQLKSAEAALRQQAAYEGHIKLLGTLKVAALAVGTATLAAGAGLFAMVKSSIDAADKLNDLSKATGISVEDIGAIGFAAKQAGTDIDSTVKAFAKLDLSIAAAARGDKEATAAFAKMGISVKDAAGQTKTAQKVFQEIAIVFNGYSEGPEKAALGNVIFHKSYADVQKLLAEGPQKIQANIDYYNQFGSTSAETARQADEFKDTLGKIGLLSEQLGNKITIALLPVLQALATQFQESGEKGGTAFDSIANGISNFARNFSIAAVNIKYVIGTIIDDVKDAASYLKAFAAGDGETAKNIREGFAARGEAARKEVDAQTKALALAVPNKPLQDVGLENLDAALAKAKRPAPPLPTRGRGAGTDKELQLAKKQLEDNLSTLDNFIREEHQKLESRNSALERLYSQDRISIGAYFDAKNEALTQNVAETAAAYEAEIQQQQQFYELAKRKKDELAALGALTKIGDLTREKNTLFQKSSEQVQKNLADEERAFRDYGIAISEIRAKVLDLANTEASRARAAQIRFSNQNREIVAKATAEKDQNVLDNIALLEKQNDLEVRLNKVRSDGQTIQDQLANSEAKVLLERNLGLKTEAETMAALGQLRTNAANQLKLIAERWQEILDGVTDPELKAALEALKPALERFKIGIDDIAGSVDILGNKLRTDFKNAADTALEGFLDNLQHGKGLLNSFKEAFNAFVTDITRQINRLAAQSITDALFKGNGASGGGGYGTAFSDFIASLFGGGGGNVSAMVAAGQLFAGGTDFVPRDGLAYVHRGERVVTAKENNGWSRGNVVNVYQSFAPDTSRRTTNQAAEQAARVLRFAQSRNS